MARSTHEFLMTSAEIAETFHDREALDLEARQIEIARELRLGRLEVLGITDQGQIDLDIWVQDLTAESKRNATRVRELRQARSETIGMKRP